MSFPVCLMSPQNSERKNCQRLFSGGVPRRPLCECAGGGVQGVQRGGVVRGEGSDGNDHLVLGVLRVPQPAADQDRLSGGRVRHLSLLLRHLPPHHGAALQAHGHPHIRLCGPHPHLLLRHPLPPHRQVTHCSIVSKNNSKDKYACNNYCIVARIVFS